MSRREELEKEIDIVQGRIGNADKDTPERIVELWKKELDSLSFELNNLYDDDENDIPD
jgi:aspartate/methionine/tyrosine aminotransferase